MVGTLDKEIIEKFKEFQESDVGKRYKDLEIETIKFKNNTFDKIISEFIKGSTPKYSTEKTDTIVIKSGQARGNYNKFNFNKITYLDVEKVKNPKYLKQGDILINTTGVGTAGRVTLFDLDAKYVSDSHITALRYDLTKFHKFYLLYFFINYGFKKLESMAEGTGGQVELSMNLVKNITIPIPEDLDEKFYTSLKIQEIIIEFFEYSFKEIEYIRERIDKRYAIFERLKKALIPSTFIKDYVKIAFGRYAREKGIGFNITDVEFEIKRIHSDKKNDIDVICQKRMGFTPKTSKTDDINWFRVEDLNDINGLYIAEPNTVKKTTIDKIIAKNGKTSSKNISIQKGDILVSFLATPGIVKIYNSDKISYCNQALDILTPNEGIDNRYLAYNCMFEYPKYGKKQTMGVNLDNPEKMKIKIFIPKDLKNYNSLEIQKIIADFIEYTENRLQEEFDRMDKGYHNLERLHKTYLARTFSLIDWGAK